MARASGLHNRLKWWGLAGLVCVFISWTYRGVVDLGYTDYDDNKLVAENIPFLLSPSAPLQAFKQDVFNDGTPKKFYRPVLTLSFIVDAHVSHGNPRMFHISNAIYHVIAMAMVFVFLMEMGLPPAIALGSIALLGVHPLLSQAVAWIPGRNDTLLSLFFLGSVIGFLRWWRSQQFRWLLIHAGLFVLAVLTKESAVLLPFMCVLAIWSGDYGNKLDLKRWKWLTVIWIAGLLGFLGLRAGVVSYQGDSSPLSTMMSMVSNLPGLFTYLGKLIIPWRLSGLPILIDMKLALVAGLGFAVGLGLFTWKMRQRRLLFGWLWFVILLLPTLLPVTTSYQYHLFLEHRAYLPLVGFLITAGLIIRRVFTRYTRQTKTGWGIYLVLLAGWSLLTNHQIQTYKDPITFWEYSVLASPHSSIAWANLGTEYYLKLHDLTKAEEALLHARELFAQQPYVNGNLANIYFDQKKYELAEKTAKKELEYSENDNAFFILGAIYAEHGYLDDAAVMWQQAIKINPTHLQVHIGLVQLFYIQKQYDLALSHYWLAKAQGVVFIPEIESVLSKMPNSRSN